MVMLHKYSKELIQMIGIYDYTVIATYTALLSAVYGIFSAFSGNALTAVLCMMAAGVIDTFDGKIARSKKDRTDAGKRFGIQIDSLNDLVCFGVLPAVIGFSLGLSGIIPLISLALFVLAALIRLAYFNVLEEKRQDTTTEARTHYLGLPVTSVSVVLPLCYIICFYFSADPVPLFTAVYFALAIAFVAPIKVRKLRLPGILLAGCVIAAEIALMISFAF